MQGLINSGMRAEGSARPQTPQQPPNNRRQPSNARPPQTQQPTNNRQPADNNKQPQQNDSVNMQPERGQRQRNVLVNSMLSSLYGPMLENAGQILQSSSNDPAKAIGRIVGPLLSVAYERLQEQNRTVTPGVMVQAGMIAAQAVGEMASRMGVITPENEAEIVESGFMVGLGRFGQRNADSLTPEQRQRYAELIDGMEEGKRMAMQGSSPERNRQMPGGQPAMQRGGNPGMMARGGA